MKKIILVSLSLTIILSCNQKKIDTGSEGQKIMQISREWSQDGSARDLEKTLSYWADDAIVMSAGQPVFKGKKEIREIVEGSFKTPGFKIGWKPQSAEVSQCGDLAYLIEKSEITMKYSAVTPLHNIIIE